MKKARYKIVKTGQIIKVEANSMEHVNVMHELWKLGLTGYETIKIK
jgi:hypothetical protein